MKYIKEFFGFNKDTKKGDSLTLRFIEIMKDENIVLKDMIPLFLEQAMKLKLTIKLLFFQNLIKNLQMMAKLQFIIKINE